MVATFDYPGQTDDQPFGTMPMGINDQGEVVGDFYAPDFSHHGFVRTTDGQFSRLMNEPNDHASYTVFTGVNRSSLICGYYKNDAGQFSSFTLSGGVYSEYSAPNAISTSLLGVNNAGGLSGTSVPTSGVSSEGFIDLGGTATTFNVANPTAQPTNGGGLNNLDQCVGSYAYLNKRFGYLRYADGTFLKGLKVGTSIATVLSGINDRGAMVGFDQDNTTDHGVVFLPNGQFFTYDYPAGYATLFTGINKGGLICGYYQDSTGHHGLIVRMKTRGGTE